MKWILIISFLIPAKYGSGDINSTVTAEFNSYEACNNAHTVITQTMRSRVKENWILFNGCFEKGTEIKSK